jgi:predicted permease
MKLIVPITFLIIAVAAGSTVVFVNALKPTSTGVFVGFTVWLMFPYAVMSAALMFLQRKGAASFHWHVAAAIVSIAGILFLANVIFWHPDAQGAIAVLMTPILQGGALALILPAAWWVSRNARA